MGATMTPLPGGWSGRTFLSVGPSGERSVVRIYPDAEAGRAQIDAALLHLVVGLVPVPAVLELREPADGAPGLLITEYVEGVRGDLLLRDCGPDLAASLGRSMGAVAAVLGSIATLRAGQFCDASLQVARASHWPELEEFVDRSLPSLRPALGWGDREAETLLALAAEAQSLLDTVPRSCLVHSDFNPKNVVADPNTGQVLALVDWEFAHSGHPFTDLGNLLRFAEPAGYQAAAIDGYLDRCPGAGQSQWDASEIRELARAADLYALTELAVRWLPVAEPAEAPGIQARLVLDHLVRRRAGGGPP